MNPAILVRETRGGTSAQWESDSGGLPGSEWKWVAFRPVPARPRPNPTHRRCIAFDTPVRGVHELRVSRVLSTSSPNLNPIKTSSSTQRERIATSRTVGNALISELRMARIDQREKK